ncbi:hypothetical protein I3842_11G087000 [Carya illinoinensis]|uniref:Pectinesterase inhibitor domain-containing protein n=1 Tax=Carya illinoinensis TaxID=32201 RepID=A0A922DPB2_CARIL|nr:hypothetical protein I3842_11G087000 [Carya illinoinensis]
MWHFSHFSFSFSFCCLYIFLVIIPHQKGSNIAATSVDIINQTCKTCADESYTVDYIFCLTSLQVIPVSHVTNLHGLALIAMELALRNATNTVSGIKKSLNGTAFDPFALACLENCLELYSGSVRTIVDSIGAFVSEHYVIAKVWLSTVMEAVATCEEGFAEKKGEVPPLTKENYDLFQLCNIALCIIHLLTPPLPP